MSHRSLYLETIGAILLARRIVCDEQSGWFYKPLERGLLLETEPSNCKDNSCCKE